MNNITFKDAYGFHTVDQWLSTDFLNDFEDVDALSTCNVIKNISTIVGYIPVIATIVAIVKAIFTEIAINYLKQELEENTREAKQINQFIDFLEGQRVRNLVELTSLGFLLLIPDLIITYERNKIYNSGQDSYELEPVYEYVVEYPYDNYGQ